MPVKSATAKKMPKSVPGSERTKIDPMLCEAFTRPVEKIPSRRHRSRRVRRADGSGSDGRSPVRTGRPRQCPPIASWYWLLKGLTGAAIDIRTPRPFQNGRRNDYFLKLQGHGSVSFQQIDVFARNAKLFERFDCITHRFYFAFDCRRGN